jgi:hypothetical protein
MLPYIYIYIFIYLFQSKVHYLNICKLGNAMKKEGQGRIINQKE